MANHESTMTSKLCTSQSTDKCAWTAIGGSDDTW